MKELSLLWLNREDEEGPAPGIDNLLLESGGNLLLETGGLIKLEAE